MKIVNLILLVAIIAGVWFYWIERQRIVTLEKEQKRLIYEYGLLEKPISDDLFRFVPLPVKRAHTYQWNAHLPLRSAIKVSIQTGPKKYHELTVNNTDDPRDLSRFGDVSIGTCSGSEQLTITTRLRPGSLRYFAGQDDSYSFEEIATDLAFTEFLTTHWDRLNIFAANLDGTIKTDLKEPLLLYELGFSKELLEEIKQVAPETAKQFVGNPILRLSISLPDAPDKSANTNAKTPVGDKNEQ